MPDTEVTLHRRDDGVAVVRLDRPKANALSVSVLEQLESAASALIADPPGAVVVWGGERTFSAGADISEFAGRAEATRIAARFRAAFDAVAAIPRTTIAAISGYALGGGCELALACDLRVVGERARLGQPEVLLGIIPGAGGTQRLSRLVGVSRAKDLVLTGRQLGAAEALRIGLVDRVVPDDGVFASAVDLGAGLAAGAVVAHAMIKRAIDQGISGSLAAGLDLEATLFADAFDTEDAAIGVESFRQSGPGHARFVGR